MKVENALERLEELLAGWGISENDWILTAQYTHKLLGRDIGVREGHLNVIVRKSSIPWKIGEELETFAPLRSKYEQEFQSFIKVTGFEFDIVPRVDDYFEKEFKDSVVYTLPNGEEIHLEAPLREVAHLDEMLSHCNEDGWGAAKGVRVLSEVKKLADVFEKAGDQETASAWRQLYTKYQYLLEDDVGPAVKKVGGVINGISASSGKVAGVARIVLDSEEVGEFHEGDVLVTRMASPRFGILIEKAGAFVTDDGGRLSHIAVLAREMNKPCVVGTKVATKVFKNGDKVEFDAEKGIVRKLT